MKKLLIAARIVTGLVFLFSGTVKAIDPSGTAFKFHDYFVAFGIHFLQDVSIIPAILLCLAEFLTGLSVLAGIRFRLGVSFMLVLTSFFTILTLFIAIKNPVSDCGCFGDAIHLTNWQTFFKNVILLILVGILYTERKRISEYLKPLNACLLLLFSALIFVIFCIYNIRYLPLIDFLPYKTGNNIPELMKMPEGAKPDRYETTFIYEKEGIRKEFTLDNYPANDSTWVFVDQKSVLAEKGYIPPIHDFSIYSLDNRNLTDSILKVSSYTLLMISRKLEQASPESLAEGFRIGANCNAAGIGFIILSASTSEIISGYHNGLTFCRADETTLKTMMRANPGYIMLRNGIIVGKWSWAKMPMNLEEMKK